jgi:dTDP-4-amino-4,6-dideoxygalactose transaminase
VLPITEQVAASVVSLPLYPALAVETVDAITEIVRRVHARAAEVAAATA